MNMFLISHYYDIYILVYIYIYILFTFEYKYKPTYTFKYSCVYKLINKLIEKVQHKFTKRIYFICNFLKSNYDTRLSFLNVMNLSHRILRSDLIPAFKILNNLVDIDKSSVITTYSTSNRGPLIKIRKDKCINKVTINSVSNIVSTAWNSLPRSVASAKSIRIFITNIDTLNINGKFYSQHA